MAPYDETLKGKYPGKLHAKKVVEYIRSKIPGAAGVIYLEGKRSKLHEDCDQEEHFRYAAQHGSLPVPPLSVDGALLRRDICPIANAASSTT